MNWKNDCKKKNNEESIISPSKDYSLEFCYKCNTDRVLDNEDSCQPKPWRNRQLYDKQQVHA